MKYLLILLLCLLVGMSVRVAQAGIPEPWSKTSYAYDGNNKSLETALKDFVDAFGIKLVVDKVSGRLHNKVKAQSAVEFLERLALEHRFQWFVYNKTLYVSPQQDVTSVSLDVSENAIADIKEALTQIGLLDDRFGWGELPDEGTVIVSGPARYVGFIKELSKKKKKGQERLEVMVFPLRYALANDRTIRYRDESVVVPGVATILQDLLERGGGRSKKNFSDSRSVSLGVNGFPGSGGLQSGLLGMKESAEERIKEQASSRASDSETNEKPAVRVSVDIRNNAVLIQDDPDREEMYQSLIEKLDLPRNVIRIDAVILDIEKGKVSELGIEWQVQSDGKEATINASGVEPFLGNGMAATALIRNVDDFYGRIRTLETTGNASLVANPSLLTIENQPAVIDFNNTAFIQSVGERVANIMPITAGTSLQVIPRAIGEKNEKLVQLSLSIEDGSIESGGASDSQVKRGMINTQAVIQEKRSLVVGGFHVEESVEQESKVPILGDIPLLGGLFRYSRRSVSQRERLFIITPRLVGTEVNPVQYVSPELRHDVGEALEKQNGRYDDSIRISRAEVQAALAAAADRYIPKGFEVKRGVSELTPKSLCRDDTDMSFLIDKTQHYESERFAILIGVVQNKGRKARRFDEVWCNHRLTLAVSVLPNAMLDAGGEAEVLIAVRRPDADKMARQTLIPNIH